MHGQSVSNVHKFLYAIILWHVHQDGWRGSSLRMGRYEILDHLLT